MIMSWRRVEGNGEAYFPTFDSIIYICNPHGSYSTWFDVEKFVGFCLHGVSNFCFRPIETIHSDFLFYSVRFLGNFLTTMKYKFKANSWKLQRNNGVFIIIQYSTRLDIHFIFVVAKNWPLFASWNVIYFGTTYAF